MGKDVAWKDLNKAELERLDAAIMNEGPENYYKIGYATGVRRYLSDLDVPATAILDRAR
jgi:hypothetical protein